MKIKGLHSISHTNADKFYTALIERVNSLQDDGQTVEIQYQMGTFPNGQIVLGALIIGRIDDIKNPYNTQEYFERFLDEPIQNNEREEDK
jgi:hypothetical protein